jgi:secreted trypsin-like serine protease
MLKKPSFIVLRGAFRLRISLAFTIAVIGSVSTFSSMANAVVSPEGFYNASNSIPQAVRIVQYLPLDGYEKDIAICTGTLVKWKVVVTAAHCLDKSGTYGYRIEYMHYNKSLWVTIQAKSWLIHQRYNEATSQNDIGLIILSKPAFGLNIPKLPPQDDIKLHTFKNLVMLGWGEDQNGLSSNELAVAYVDDYTKKANAYFGSWFNPTTMIAAGRWRSDERLFTGACDGDSGGPLFASLGLNNYLVGITSFGDEDCNSGTPTAFTKVSAYTNWIRSNWNHW